MSTSEYRRLFEKDVGEKVYDVTLTANDEHLVSGSCKAVQVWSVKDGGKHIATMEVARGAFCVAASSDGRYIAAGSATGGFVSVWDAKTYKQVSAHKAGSDTIRDVDFSPDSTRLVCADSSRFSESHTATIWDITARKQVQTLKHDGIKTAAYSPQGERIATAAEKSVRVWDSDDGRLLVDVEVGVSGQRSLCWRNNHLFVTTEDRKIRQINASTGSTIKEWPVSHTSPSSCITQPQHKRFLAYFAGKTVSFLDTTSIIRPKPAQHTDDIRSIACSSNGKLLVIAAERKITVKDTSSVAHRFVSVAPDSAIVFWGPSFANVPHLISEPQLDIDAATLNAWKHGQLTTADESLSAAISVSENTLHHVLAGRALVRSQLGLWDAALADANQSIGIQRSVLGYVAKSVVLVRKGGKDEGIRVCDIAFEHFPEHVSLLLLIKALVLFIAGDHVDAISRMNDLITDSAHPAVDPVLYGVQAYMHLLRGNKFMESNNYKYAILSFKDARNKLGNLTPQPPLIVSLISGWSFDDLVITVQQRLCEALLAADRTKEAVQCLMPMLDEGIDVTDPVKTWVSDFKHRCRGRSEDLGDNAIEVEQYDKAISQYTAALALESATPQYLLVKRSRAYARQGKWEDALNDARHVIDLDPSSLSGYERKYAALLGIGHRDEAIDAFETMLSKMSESSDSETRERSRCYVHPERIMEVIRTSIEDAIRDSPLVLINVLSGRLCNKSEQATAFELTPAFTTLIVSMTTHIDHARIKQVVDEFYRYATFSHTWEKNEPLYEEVVKIVVYNLETSPTHEKLCMFCKVVRDEGIIWVWSDTCCIDKGNQSVLQESLVSMFKWYEGSAMTIIFLFDVDRLAEFGALTRSRWNSRAWTFQEYHASKVVRIYTKDWTPYLGLTIYNHKESPEIIREMEEATGISAQSLVALRPGLRDIREKLCLASSRHTTRVEDAAYSLLGIFSMTLPTIYGEGDKALGRLLSQLLASSGDTSILAWTGTPGSYNSCLPKNIIVFGQPLTSHIPPSIPDTEMTTITARLRGSSLDANLVTALYDQLSALPLPSFSTQRMKLPCLAFKISSLSPLRNERDGSVVFRAQADALRTLEIKTRLDIARVDHLYLAHPWVDFLLNRHTAENIDIPSYKDEILEFNKAPLFNASDLSSTLDGGSDASPLPSPTMLLTDEQMGFLARLGQPFGALLLAPTRRNVPLFRRIATENIITCQVEALTSVTLSKLIEGVRVLDVL